MTGVDTDVLVSWAMAGAPHHGAVRRWFESEVRQGRPLALALQTLHEFLHVATDARRFEVPLTMGEALRLVRGLWSAREVQQVLPSPAVLDRTADLLERLRLGRKRILDTALAATFEAAGVRRVATFNRADFEVFGFLQIVTPFPSGALPSAPPSALPPSSPAG